MKIEPTIYVLAGANGIGKTTLNARFVPNGVPFINADDIAKQLREQAGGANVQEQANAEALYRMNQLVEKRADFAIETNLADEETWQFLAGIQKIGYRVELNFFSAPEVSLCISRVKSRFQQGGHFVNPETVVFRYEAGLRLLKKHKNVPDRLFLTDNSGEIGILCVELKKGELVFRAALLPEWAETVVADFLKKAEALDSIEQVRAEYKRLKK